MSKTAAKFAFYLVAGVLILWTSTLTVTFVSSVLPNMHFLVPFFALVVFDGGMLAWLFVFIYYGEGAGQRTVAIALTILDLIGVALMATAEIFLGGQTLVAAPEMLGAWALWGIGGWTVLNVAGVVFFHLLDPAVRQEMAIREEMDAVQAEALNKLKSQRVQHSGVLSDILAKGMMAELTARLEVDRDGDGVPDVFQRQGRQPTFDSLPPTPLNDALYAALPPLEPLDDDAYIITADRRREMAARQRGYAESNDRKADALEADEAPRLDPHPVAAAVPGSNDNNHRADGQRFQDGGL